MGMIGIIQGISAKVRQMTKSAQVDSYYWLHTNDPVQNEINNHMSGQVNAAALKGIAKGVRESVPSFSKYFLGPVAGAINGGIHAMTGGRFSTGYKDSTEFMDDYVAKPWRYAAEYYAGGPARKLIGGMDSYHDRKTMEAIGSASPEERKSYDYFRNKFLPGVSGFSQGATQVALSWPMYAGWYKYINPMSRMVGAIPGAGKGVTTVAGAVDFAAPTLAETAGRMRLKIDRKKDDDALMENIFNDPRNNSKIEAMYRDPETSEDVRRIIESRRPDLRQMAAN